jgi:aerobic-type carbon monoxide dehydrogenase small subunit (CoxS/CutS family)
VSTIKLTVNGKAVSADVEDRTLLVHLLRDHLGLLGPMSDVTPVSAAPVSFISTDAR